MTAKGVFFINLIGYFMFLRCFYSDSRPLLLITSLLAVKRINNIKHKIIIKKSRFTNKFLNIIYFLT